MLVMQVVHAPWSPHVALHVQLTMVPRATMVRSIVEPLPLPMEEFAKKWKNLNEVSQSSMFHHANVHARKILVEHANKHGGPAILGTPLYVLVEDPKFKHNIDMHIKVGEQLAHAALQAELLVCKVAGVEYQKYIGRSQYCKFVDKPSIYRNGSDDKFSSPAANFWGVLAGLLCEYLNIRAKLSGEGAVYCSTTVGNDVPILGQRPSGLKEQKSDGADFP